MITKIKVTNFKAFLKEEIPLAQLNLLTGINGLGKSTIIQILLLLRQSFNKGLIPNKGVLLNGDLIKLGRASDVLNIHSDEKKLSFQIEFNHEKSIEFNLEYNQDNDFLPLEGEVLIPKEILETALFTSSLKYLSAERISPKSAYATSLFEVNQNRGIGIHGEFTPHFLAQNQREKVSNRFLLHPNSTSDDLLTQVICWAKEIAPGISLTASHLPQVEASRIAYQYELGSSLTPEFSPTNVGFGVTYVMPVLTSILSSRKGDLIIIENPESHLHPSGQSRLGELFFRAAISGVQLLVETHSDHFLNGVRLAIKKAEAHADLVNILFFQRPSHEEKHSTQIFYPKLDNRGNIEIWPDGFFDQSLNDINQLLGL